LLEHMISLKKEPPIRPGTLDPYDPAGKKDPTPEGVKIPVD
jgi:hypothetical protein